MSPNVAVIIVAVFCFLVGGVTGYMIRNAKAKIDEQIKVINAAEKN